MTIRELTIRYLIMIPGVFLLCFGIAFITKAGLGNSPISSVPYALSLIQPRFTMGNYTILINLCLVAAQWIMLHDKPGSIMGRPAGKAITVSEIIVQFLISLAMGYGIDFSLFLLQWMEPVVYWQKLLFLLAGVCIMSLGIAIQMEANVAMAPGDAFSRALTAVLHKPFNRVRVAADCSLVAIAVILCLVFLHRLVAVREGTVICALLTGNLVKFYRWVFARCRAALFSLPLKKNTR
ncbi:MAG: hypothetical protein IJI20_05360 [Firmicutes bacterium]|nr:hypothetical protein [Bacillota bacterium]